MGLLVVSSLGCPTTPPVELRPEPSCTRPEPQITLPADDRLHDASTEWWYWTGHLTDGAGRWFGFQTTFFVFSFSGLRAQLSNAALTDISGRAFHRQATFSFMPPEAVDAGFHFSLATAQAHGGDGYDTLEATLPDAGYSLSLEPGQTPTLQHGDGREDYAVGGYTYYYSRTRMPVSGTVRLGSEAVPVQGHAWFDHQWGDLDAVQANGWDWFSLQLDDGRDVMLFLVHGANGPSLVGGTITQASGCPQELKPEDVKVTATGTWTGPSSQCTYPQGWQVELPELSLTVTPVLPEQEFYNARDNSKTYWEGAATVSGTVTGRAYVELTGYCP